MIRPHVHSSIDTSFLVHLFVLLILYSSRSIPTVSGFPSNTNNVCDVNTPITVHRSPNTGGATRVVLSSARVGPGGSLTVTLSGTIRGFVLYAANAAGIHKGVLTNNANSAICGTIPTGSDTGSTIRHTNSNTKLNQQFVWTAPTLTGVYTFYAMVTESGGSAPVYRLPVVSVTVQAPGADPVVTQPPPVVNPVPSVPTPSVPMSTNPPKPKATNPPDNDNDDNDKDDDDDDDNYKTTRAPTTIPTTQSPKPPVTGTSSTTPPPSTAPGDTATGRIIPSLGATRLFDIATLSLHATPKTDCWTSMNNVVYDITTLFNNHPGGDSTLISWCGKDCTSIFASVHSTASADVAKLEANYRIGVLSVLSDNPVTQAPPVGAVQPDQGVIPSALSTTTNTQSGMSNGVYIGLIGGGIGVAIVIVLIVCWRHSKKSIAVAPPNTSDQCNP